MQGGASCAQGEVIEQQFGEKELCFRTLDLYTSAVLEASLNPTTSPKPEWRGAMDLMSEVSNLSFRLPLLGVSLHACCTASCIITWLVATPASGLLQQRLVACCNTKLWLGQQQLLHLHLLEALIFESMYSLRSGSHRAAQMPVDGTTC